MDASFSRLRPHRFHVMIRDPEKVADLERRFARERLARMSYADALAIFAALWQEASMLNPQFPGNWRDDLEADFAVGRAVNGLSAT